ncbi:MAG: hypothetical protein ACJ8F7_19745 [Gemmataceae bacterium]
MMRVLFWKDLREQRVPAVVMTLLGCAVLVVALPMFGFNEREFDTVVLLAAIFAGACGMVTGAILLANEHESGTHTLLDILPAWRGQLFGRKFVTGLILTLIQAYVLAGATELTRPSGQDTMGRGVMALLVTAGACVGLSCGLFGSALGRTVLAAIGWAIVGLFIPFAFAVLALELFIAQFVTVFPEGRHDLMPDVPAAVAASLVPLALARWLYTRPDGLRRRSVRYRGAQEVRTARSKRVWGMRPALWVSFRQGWRFYLGLLVASLVCSPLLLADPVLAWPSASLLLGTIAGIAVLGDEQHWGSFRFLAEQRLPLGRLWLWKVLSRAAISITVAALAVLAAYLVWSIKTAVLGGHSSSMWEFRFHGGVAALVATGMRWQFVLVWGVYGFCFGHLAGLLARKTLVSFAVGLTVSGLVLAVWLPSLLSGGVPDWQLYGLPLAMLLAARLLLWPWATERLLTRRMIPAWAALVAGVLLWIGGSLAYRVVEVPNVAPPFDVAAFVAGYPKPEDNKARDLIIQSAGRVPENPPGSDKRFGAPSFNPPGSELSFDEKLDRIQFLGWPQGDAQFEKQLDGLAAAGIFDPLLEVSRQPLGMLADRNAALLDQGPPALQRLWVVPKLVAARALQLQARGDHAAAFALLRAQLAVARAVANHGTSHLASMANPFEVFALLALQRWATDPNVPIELLREALAEVRRHEAARPTFVDSIKANYLLVRRACDNPLSLFGNSSQQRPGEDVLLMLPAITPWERTRREHLLNTVAAYQLADAETDYPTLHDRTEAMAKWLRKDPVDHDLERSMWPAADRSDLERRRHFMEQLNDDSLLFWLRSFMAADRSMRSQWFLGVCRLRATQLYLALILHQRETGRVAKALADLVAQKIIERVPLDPFSGQEFHYRLSAGEVLDWEPLDLEKGSPDFAATPDVRASAIGGMTGGPGGGMAGGGMGIGGPGDAADFAPVGLLAGGAGAAAHPQFVGVPMSQKRRVRPGDGVLWSVGADGLDNGGLKQGGFTINLQTIGADIILVVPKVVK